MIAGPNGAGKSTFASAYLPAVGCGTFHNADVIAAEMRPDDVASVAVAAGREFLERVDASIKRRETFAVETTLSGKSYIRLIRDARLAGYEVSLSFVWVPTPEQSVERVAQRVSVGGHHIPTDVVHRRHALAIRNLFQTYIPLVNEWRLFDNSASPPRLIGIGLNDATDTEAFMRYYREGQRPIKG